MMKSKISLQNKILSVLAILWIGILVACSDAQIATPFSVSESELVFLADGGQATIELSSGEEWTVSCDCEWCMVTPTNGVGSTTCEIRVDSSYLYKEREAHLTFRNESHSYPLTIRQFGYEKVIRLEKSSLEVPDFTDYDALFEEIKVESNVDYDVLVEYADPANADWLSVKKEAAPVQSIPRTGKVRMDYKMYMSSEADRQATVVFRQNDAAPGETPIESRLTFVQKRAQEIIPSREGDSLALLALSRIMHLSTGWDTSRPMIYWNNVKLDDVTYYNAKLQRTITEPRVVEVAFTMFDTNEGIPYQIQFLDQLRVLSFTANANAHLKRIELGDDVCSLKNLKSLALVGYGITALPEAMKEMTNLEELELSGNNLTEIPMDVITALDQHKLWYVNMANNRRRDVYARLYENVAVRDTLGLHGTLPEELFQLKNVCYIGLSYNYLEGSIPDMGYDASVYTTLEEKIAHNPVMPQLEQLSVNLNYLTGELPDWVLYHPNLRCWDPYTLTFNQYEQARDSRGRMVGFSNEPTSVEQACKLWYDDDAAPDDNANYLNVPYNRQNTFNPYLMYDVLRGEPVTRR